VSAAACRTAARRRDVVRAFQLDADGKVVAARPPFHSEAPACQARSSVDDVLAQLAVAPDEEVRGDLEALDLLK
jgi:hypothetical protein